jgi:hypothetical protein
VWTYIKDLKKYFLLLYFIQNELSILRILQYFSNSLLQVSVWRRPTLSPTAVCMLFQILHEWFQNFIASCKYPGVFIIFPIRVCIDIISRATALCPTCITLNFKCLYMENKYKYSCCNMISIMLRNISLQW